MIKIYLITDAYVINLIISANQKHYPPSLNDEVWRLKHISKDGKVHKRLSNELGINTVNDLLQLHKTNPSLLKEVLRKTSIVILLLCFVCE